MEDYCYKYTCIMFIIYLSLLLLFKNYLFYFTTLYWFCHTLTWIHHGCICVPHPEPPSQLLPHPIPLGHPSAPAPSILYHASNLNWRFISNMIIYMFQCHSPLSSHPRPLPQSPKDCSISVSLLLSRIKGYRYHLSKFHIYVVSILYWCFSFWLTSLCIIGSSFIHLVKTDSNVFFLMAE